MKLQIPLIRIFLLILLFPGLFLTLGFSSNSDSVKGTKDWSIVASYDIPGKASGLAWDGTYLYFGIYGANGDQVYQFDPTTGNSSLLFTNPTINDSYGMTYDGNNLWITDHGLSSSIPAYAFELNFSGDSISQFFLPDHYMSGIAFDDPDFWVCTYYPNPGTIYKVDATGAILSQIPSPNLQPWDICTEGDNLWVADYDGNALYKIDQEGNILETHPCENIKPSGIVFDGQYLWYVDGQLSSPGTLYKVDLGGSGTPQITVPVTEYNYGIVAIGDSATWNCVIQNTGTAPLVITNLIVPNAVPIFHYSNFPQNIEPGNYIEIPLIYKPTESGNLNTTLVVESNDPITAQVDLNLTGEAVMVGPHIQLVENNHDFGTIRSGATKMWFLQISNDGNEPLEVSSINFDDSHFYLVNTIIFPLTVSVLETIDVGIWFHPDSDVTISSFATITHNDPLQGPLSVNLTGTGIQQDYPIGSQFWNYTINTSWDNSIKGIAPIQDVSGDGINDVIIASEDGYTRCFNGNSAGQSDLLWENESGSVQGQNDLVIIEDINNDGYMDVIAGLVGGVRAVKAFSGINGELIWIYDTHQYGDGGWVYQVWAGMDYNNDGISDVLASTGNDGNNTGPKRIFCLNGLSGSIIWETYTDGPNFSVIGVSDFTGDGLPDVIGGASNLNETEGRVYGINGSSGNIMWSFITGGTSVWALEQLDDATGDDIKDIVAGDFGGNIYLINPSNGNAFATTGVGSSIILRFEQLDDVNNNGYRDIAVGYSGTNAIVFDGLNGNNIWLQGLADKCWNIDRIEDITGDGINDLVAGTLYSGNYAYFLDGTSGNVLFSQNYGEAVDGIASIPDINGDGSSEMVVGGRQGKIICYSGGINANPMIADFVADTTYGPVPLLVNFTDLSIGNINSWQWDFDNDGIVDSEDQNPAYTYTETGTYSVKLTIGDGINSTDIIKSDYITADTAVGINLIHSTDVLYAVPNPLSSATTIIFSNNIVSFSTPLYIYNNNGRLIKTLEAQLTKTSCNYFWDCSDMEGQQVSSGIYLGMIKNNNQVYNLKLIVK